MKILLQWACAAVCAAALLAPVGAQEKERDIFNYVGQKNAPKDIEVFQIDIRKRAAEEIFRQHRPEAVIHMATVTHLTVRNEDRYRINLFGTRAVFDHCAHYGAKRCIFVGRHTYYGAAADYNRAQFRLYRALGQPAQGILGDNAGCPTTPASPKP